jgi:hypothetical protein
MQGFEQGGALQRVRQDVVLIDGRDATVAEHSVARC